MVCNSPESLVAHAAMSASPWCPAGSADLRTHSALSAAAGDPDLVVKARRFGLFPGKCCTTPAACSLVCCMWPGAITTRNQKAVEVFMLVRPSLLLRLCAGLVSARLKGPTVKPVLPVACFDANAKANHYRSAGKASSSSFEQLPRGRFFADAQADVWNLHAAGPLPLSSTGTSGLGDSNHRSGSSDDASAELQAVEDSCHPRITCARETSLCSSISDVCGVAAGVCSHGQPLLGCALAMPAPERFVYYDLILSHLLSSADVQLMYLDTACSYAPHWRDHMPEGVGPTAVKVGWWHARGHGPACFLKNSGLYCLGEET